MAKAVQKLDIADNAKDSRLNKAKDNAADKLSDAAEFIDRQADSTHEYLDGKTDRIEENARERITDAADAARGALGRGRDAGHAAADRIRSTSDLVRETDLDEVRQNAADRIRNNPGLVVASAGMAGLIIGLLIGRRL
ncbi:MAG: hypothetical protein DWQ47_14630 [Acidobacteria bacterium]|nr:MAG: hypothetical protein DWQ32_02030 [Acidobacteriota bacterium]REK02698.1 MAG: hypothetical protein DWQ38_10105 [Acidobacteriota bacterium]REK13497.1 MAG: hypothetical protein DWQ43_07720 [Acidobacteriota bacterium]REK41491.1 MAG: hypothetical protein DWQ47_14630 [Acidobacteriota bacterium]